MENFTVEQVAWRDNLDKLRSIRTTVFVEEQNVSLQEEWDGRDENAIHVLALTEDRKPIGTARLLDSGQIGRMAVLREYRRHGIGSAMLRLLLEIAKKNRVGNLFLNAQVEAIGFYSRYGFIEQGETFMEAGIAHRRMVLRA